MIFINPESRINTDIPNIGLAYAATYFSARGGSTLGGKVKVIDQNTKPRPRDRFLDYETDVLGISVQSRTYHEAQRIAKAYRAKYPASEVKSISGFLDVQCCYPYLDFKDRITYDKPFSDDYPFPNYELFDSVKIFRKNWQKGKWSYAIMTSQGCPYQCIYCVSRNRKWRARSPENCYQELKEAKKKWGIKSFAILDDCFNIDRERVIEFCELIKPLQLKWVCSNGLRADKFDEEMAKAMSESGCRYINFGVESVIPQVLETIKKGETIEQIEGAVDIAKRYFREVSGFFIIGLPGSSYERDLESLSWAKEEGINAHFSYYLPFDKGMSYDELFYGRGARSLSDAYPKNLQKKIYKMTEYMREEKGLTRRLKCKIKRT